MVYQNKEIISYPFKIQTLTNWFYLLDRLLKFRFPRHFKIWWYLFNFVLFSILKFISVKKQQILQVWFDLRIIIRNKLFFYLKIIKSLINLISTSNLSNPLRFTSISNLWQTRLNIRKMFHIRVSFYLKLIRTQRIFSKKELIYNCLKPIFSIN